MTPDPLAAPKPAELKPEGAAEPEPNPKSEPEPKPEATADPDSEDPEEADMEVEVATGLEYTAFEYAGLEDAGLEYELAPDAATVLLGVSLLGISDIPALGASLAAALKASRVLPVLSSGLRSC